MNIASKLKEFFLTQQASDKTRKWCVKRFRFSESSVEKNSIQYWPRWAQRISQVAQGMEFYGKKLNP